MTNARSSTASVAGKLVLAQLVLAVLTPLALAAPDPGSRLALERVKLDNGVSLVLSTQSSVPIVAMTCLVDGGARVDPAGKGGVAGLTGSLLSEGTTGRTSQEIALLVDSLGASFSTGAGQDWVEVDVAVLARDFETGVDLVGRSLREPTFPDAEVARVRAEALGALQASEENPHTVAQRAFRKALFGDGPYGHPVDGTPKSVEGLTRDDIVAYHRREIAPDRTICTIVGDVETARMREVAKRLLGSWKNEAPPNPARSPSPAPPARSLVVDMPVSQASIVLGQLGIARSNPDYFPVLLMNHVLGGGGFTSRLMQRVRTEGGLAYGVSSSFASTRLPWPFAVSLQTKVESAAEADRLVRAEIQKVHDEGVTAEELAAAKDYLTGSFPLRLDSTSKLAGFLAQVEYFGLGDDYVARYAERVRAVSVEDVRRAAAKYLAPRALVQVVVGPRPALVAQGLDSSPAAP